MSDIPQPREVPEEYKRSMRELGQWTENDRPTMSEVVFKNHVLPILTSKSDDQVDLTFWLEIAGTPLRGIDVVDEAGNLLFHCPPLMRALPTVAQEEMNYYQIVSQASLHEAVHPAQAQRYLDEQLSKARHGATLLDVETAKQWNSIRQRYNLPLLTIGKEGKAVAQPSGSQTEVGTGTIQLEEDQEDF